MDPMGRTLIGAGKPGLVNAASAAVAAHGGTWLESRLARLAGKFAGIVLIEAPDENAAALTDTLRKLESAGLKITVERGAAQAPASAHGRHIDIEIVGNERPGIVRDLTQSLKNLGANIEEFSSGVESAAFTGGELFRANIRVGLPDTLRLSELKGALEKLAGEIMVDLTLGDE